MQSFLSPFQTSMELRGFAHSTKKLYAEHLIRFSQFCGKQLNQCTEDDILTFLHHAITVRKLSSSYINSAYSALRFYYETTLRRPWQIRHIPRVKKQVYLPQILSVDEVRLLLDTVENLKHKAILGTIYSAGLRVHEAMHLKITDIDSKNMRIRIMQGKGQKDRTSILSSSNLLLLRAYWKQYRPTDWLFPGQDPSKPLSTRTPQKTFNEVVQKIGLKKHVTLHSLRHSFATHMLNQGASILQIKELLGHGHIQTTAGYLHLTNSQVFGLKSPLDTEDSHD